MQFGKRLPYQLKANLKRKRLADVADAYRAVRARLADPQQPIDLALIKRHAVLRSILQHEGCAA